MIDIKKINIELKEKIGAENVNDLPRLDKVIVGVGIGKAKDEKNMAEEAQKTLATITGQRPVLTKAKQAIAGFKIREGDPVGVMVTLRGQKMLDFVERLASVALPRIRDFKGMPANNFDKQGNYTYGAKEQIIFPEIPYDKISHIHGFQVTFKIIKSNPKFSRKLMEALGYPFEKKVDNKGAKNG